MKQSDIEIILNKAIYISFGVGLHPDSEGKDLPGTISLGFNNEEIYDAVDLYKHLSQEFSGFEKEIKITDIDTNMVDVGITIKSNPISIFNIKNIRCSTMEYNLDWFRKKETGRSVLLCFRHNAKPTTLEGTAIFMGIASAINQMQPILIHSWNG